MQHCNVSSDNRNRRKKLQTKAQTRGNEMERKKKKLWQHSFCNIKKVKRNEKKYFYSTSYITWMNFLCSAF